VVALPYNLLARQVNDGGIEDLKWGRAQPPAFNPEISLADNGGKGEE